MFIEKMLSSNIQSLDAAIDGIALGSAANASRRSFIKMSVGGAAGIAIVPGVALAQGSTAAAPKPGQKPTEQPAAFITIAKDGTTTILCNRMDMGQGIETALAMICAEELDADWSKVNTAFGNQRGNYVDPAMGMHLTGGSNSIKNSYTQYRELGARTRAMLIAAAAKEWKLDATALTAANGVVSGGGKRLGYGQLFDAALKESVPESVVLKDPKSFKIIGKPTSLKVSKEKATGSQKYGIDVKLPGMLTAVVLRPPVFGGKLKSMDASAALKVKGVRAVLPVDLDRGAKGVAVIADGYWPAKLGRDAIKLEWDNAGVAKADNTALLAQYRELAKTAGLQAPGDQYKADLSALANAPKKLSAEFVFPYLNHAQMEPLACTVDLKANACSVYTASQMPGVDAAAIAKATGLSPDQVNIHVQMAGGGFGRRAVPTSEYVIEATNVAKAYAATGKRAPIKVVHSREDDVKAGYYRPFTLHRAEIGYDNEGKIVAWDHKIVSQSILKGSPFEAFLVKAGVDGTTTEGMREPYSIPMQLSVHHPQINVPVLWWRSVGSTHTAFVMETLLDEIAAASNKDPVTYRMGLLADDARGKRHKETLQLAVEKSGYGKKQLASGMHWGVAMHESFESVVAFIVEAGVKDGKPVIGAVTASLHCNFCVNPRTVETQIQGSALMALATTQENHAITLKDGVVQQSNFHDFPMPRITDMPNIAVHIVPSNDPPKGVGEPGLPPFAPALANALRRATGKPLREMPFKLA